MTGPWFEDLTVGWRHRSSALLVDAGLAATYLALSGDHGRIGTDPEFGRSLGLASVALNPALLAQVAIGQSTPATREVVANLHYRDVIFHRLVPPGTALITTTTVRAREWARPRPDRPPRGKVLLELETTDHAGTPVLTLRRLALVAARSEPGPGEAETMITSAIDAEPKIDLAATAARLGGARSEPAVVDPGWRTDALCEPVTDPVALVRLTGNLARAHRDPRRGQQGRPLVYGGHTLALAQAALTRLFGTDLVVVGWRSCDHPAPVFADDLLRTSARLVDAVGGDRGIVAELEVITDRVDGLAINPDQGESPVRVQNWRPYAILTNR